MPLGVFGEAVFSDELVLLLRGRLVFAPCVPLIEHELSLIHKLLAVTKSGLVKPDCHNSIRGIRGV
jgi:hypothetical protein